jgi:hypothetical protein
MQDKSKEILKEFAEQYHFDWRILGAILMKESNQEGYDKKAKIKIRFEKHIMFGFRDVLLGVKKRHPSLPGLKPEWIKKHSVDELNMLSTSFGMAQIMGYWYDLLNYPTVKEMVDAWQASEEIQIRDFCLFCISYNEGRFLTALKLLNYQSIATQYNGRGYAQNNYDKDLQTFFAKQN